MSFKTSFSGRTIGNVTFIYTINTDSTALTFKIQSLITQDNETKKNSDFLDLYCISYQTNEKNKTYPTRTRFEERSLSRTAFEEITFYDVKAGTEFYFLMRIFKKFDTRIMFETFQKKANKDILSRRK